MASLFSRPVRLFGNFAVLILCVVLFLTPFALRGARMSVERMENNVKDWLPSDFPETVDLEWFGQHFAGEQFVLLTWPGCSEADPVFRLLVKKLRNELFVANDHEAIKRMAEGDDPASRKRAAERLRARKIGDRLGLLGLADTDTYHENWGGRGEKWLRGTRESWYFITPAGELYRWSGQPNLWSGLARSIERLVRGENRAEGELIAKIGDPMANEFHRDPRRLGARFFKTIETGPGVVAQLTAEGGPLWPRLSDLSDEEKPFVARKRALERLTGSLFGPAVESDFDWKPATFLEALPARTRRELPADWEPRFEEFVERLIRGRYDGQRSKLLAASAQTVSSHWEDLFFELEVEPPARQTCIVVTLSEPGKRKLGRVIGRPLMGNPPGKLIDLAMNECQLKLSDLKLGGPPVDNVAIDEEGTITLFNLIGWSAVMGLGLSYLCFRSIKLTIMVFFVGGVSAVTSLSIVWWCGASVDAILMSMPSLVYVLGLAGAVHIVNYYQEAVRSHGLEGAPERALADGWGPCTLAAFTTALGLLSLVASNLLPIKKFGLYSAIGVVATLTLLFTYLPAALQIWPVDPRKANGGGENTKSWLARQVERFWVGVGRWIIKRHAAVAVGGVALMIGVGLGLAKIDTSVQLLKLFDADSKIIRDYRWMEANFGKLVPMELVVRVQPSMQRPTIAELADHPEPEPKDARFQLNFLERMELTARVQRAVESAFGEGGTGEVGLGLSAATFAPDLPAPDPDSVLNHTRRGFNVKLEQSRDEFLASDYLRTEPLAEGRANELWRISLRLGALNDVDYGEFLHKQKLVVEPILAAYRHREKVLRELDRNGEIARAKIGILGIDDPASRDGQSFVDLGDGKTISGVDQARLFAATLKDLLRTAGCQLYWSDLSGEQDTRESLRSDAFKSQLERLDCVVLIRDHPNLDLGFVRQHAGSLIDARDHRYELDAANSQTAVERQSAVQVVYTGVVPVVYKAQRTLLNSLTNSIGLAFVMIAAVMMILLRDWRSKLRLSNVVNLPAGVVSMVPNVFPVVLIFGAMGHGRVPVDIGTMMCASVAMGVAVDDTIHFLSWFRKGLRDGLDRHEALIGAYRRVATAMTQTTLIGGLGLSVFALSTFTPTQRFGVMMVTLLVAALIGDLIFLPALLAGPLGRFFCPRHTTSQSSTGSRVAPSGGDPVEARAETPHSRAPRFRTDARHRAP